MEDLDAVKATARPILARMELLSHGTVQRVGGRRGSDSYGTPPGEGNPLHDVWREAIAKTTDVEAARLAVQGAADALDAAVRRRFVAHRTETLDELCARIITDGRGISDRDCAVAMRCTTTLVRRSRLEAGCHPDTGEALPAAAGDALTWARELAAAGLPVRQIERLTGVSKSRVHRLSRP